ncbi:MAG: hypothetical protein MZW92_36525 [Comamonadaceae bacterium]|nr:hypothetical protein [Comamonadaceae bacterium]
MRPLIACRRCASARDDVPLLAQHFARALRARERPHRSARRSRRTRCARLRAPRLARQRARARATRSSAPCCWPAATRCATPIWTCPGRRRPSPLAESFQAAKARAVAQFERRYIEQALASCDGNITHAAGAVAKNRRAFWQLMRKHGIDSDRFRNAAGAPAPRA